MSTNALSDREENRTLAWRWVKFNLVGGIGVGVQLEALWLFTNGIGWGYLVATGLAVETAVLHNFFWHERFTWPDRMRGHWRDSAARLLRFNLTNGCVSIVGNILLMRILVEGLHLPILSANAVSIASCSLANFILGERYVFRLR